MKKDKINYSELGKERIVTIGDLAREIARRFLVVIILAVLFAILLGAYKYHKDVQTARANAANTSETVVADTILSEEEVTEVKNVMYVKQNIDDLQTYIDNSVLMQIDAENESRVVLQYRLEVPDDEEASQYIKDLLSSYQSYVQNRALAADLVEEGYNLDVQYLGELVSFTDNSADSDSESEEATTSTSFTLTITHINQTSVEHLADLIEDLMDSYRDTLTDSIGSHELTLINRSYMSVVNTNRRTYKSDRIGNILSMQDRVEEMEAELSSAQKELLSQYEAQGYISDTWLDEETMPKTELETEPVVINVHISWRYVAIGIVVGIVIAFLYIIAAYILRGSINSANDLRYLYNMRVLGEVRLSTRKNPFLFVWDKLIRKKRAHPTQEQQVEVLIANLKSVCQEAGVSKILLNGNAKLDADRELAEKIGEEMAQFGVETEYVTDLPYSADSIEKLDGKEAVVLLEKIRYSDYDTLEAEIRTCVEHEVEIAGAVVFS